MKIWRMDTSTIVFVEHEYFVEIWWKPWRRNPVFFSSFASGVGVANKKIQPNKYGSGDLKLKLNVFESKFL